VACSGAEGSEVELFWGRFEKIIEIYNVSAKNLSRSLSCKNAGNWWHGF